MDFGGVQSGFGAAWADLREFLTALRWSRPGLLWLSFVPISFLILEWWASARNRVVAARLGRSGAVRNLAVRVPRRSALRRLAFGFAWSSFVLALAGPRWGSADDGGVVVGRDVVIVIDLSRSMLATDLATPQARWQAARDSARDLVDTASRRGGHRIGIVVFAARPKVLVPLTTDYDHLNLMLGEIDAAVQPVEIRPADEFSKSGTRIGAALAVAVQIHDERFPGKQDIVLLSDGDDPADDREWAEGIAGARAVGIPIHVIGIGDTVESPVTLRRRGGGEGELIATKLVEEPLRTIARDSRGRYFSAGREKPRLGEFFAAELEKQPSRELTDDAATALRDRSTGFWLFGLVTLLLAWIRRA